MCFIFFFLGSTERVFDGFNVSLLIIPVHVYSSIAVAGESAKKSSNNERRENNGVALRNTIDAEDEQTDN